MCSIPGLTLLPDENEDENVIEIPSFKDCYAVKESYKHGNCRRISEFLRVNNISEGEFFNMYLCRDLKAEQRENALNSTEIEENLKQYRHLKKFKMSPNFENGVRREIIREFNILFSLKHVNIIKSYGPVTGSNVDSNYLLLDYCPFSLKDIIEKNIAIYDESVVKCIIQQLFQGLMYMHSSLVIHRNVNSENIVFNRDGILKITGFQYSCYDNGDLKTPVKSVIRYQAPELLLISDEKAYNTKVDMWSVGCVLAEFGLKKPLFEGTSNIEVLGSVFKILGAPNETIWPGFNKVFTSIYDGELVIVNPEPYCFLTNYITGASTPCFDIINNLLFYSAKCRLSAKECLKSNYFKEHPAACSMEHLATILQASVKTPVKTTVKTATVKTTVKTATVKTTVKTATVKTTLKTATVKTT